MKAKYISGLLGGALLALPAAGLFSSCSLVKEDLEECVTPQIGLRFIYDYNMEFANAFPKQVDCLTAYFFDDNGNLVLTETVTDQSLLSNEDWRMQPDLQPGNYHVVAYGGMGCEFASFSHVNDPTDGLHYSNLHVQMNNAALTDVDQAKLHNHFYGALDFTVNSDRDSHGTVEMMRNTNSVQIALQHVNGSPIDYKDFVYEITDDNNDFDHANNLMETGKITYIPYNQENKSTGTNEGATQDYHAAVARFTTSRLVYGKSTPTTLTVSRADDNTKIFSVPLLNYMLMFKHDAPVSGTVRALDDQEYLDRENAWNFVFFLDDSKDNMWVSSRIIINDWEVRFNNGSFY